jgi:hypothetical protein
MRSTSAILICLGAAGLTPCFADPPASTAATQPAATAASAPASAATPAAPATGQSPAEAKTAASPDKTASAQSSTPAAPTLDADERHLMDLGYQPEMHNGTKLWCKRQQEIGSRLGSSVKECGTATELVLSEQRAREQFNRPAATVQPGSVSAGK